VIFPDTELEALGCLVGVAPSLFIGVFAADGLVVVALDLKFDVWRRLDCLVDIFIGLIECDEVSDVATGRMRARPDHVKEVGDPHAVMVIQANVENERDRTVENAHHRDTAEAVEVVEAGYARFVGHDEHVVLVDYILSRLSGLLVPSDTVEAIVLPLALNSLTIFVGEAAVSMLYIVAELSFVHSTVGHYELAVAVSHILGPITVVG